MKSISAISLLAVACDAITFTTNTAIACNGNGNNGNDPFDNLDITVKCNDRHSLHCAFGDTAVILGTVEAIESFSNSVDVTLTTCVLNYYCPKDEENTRSAGSLCDDWLVPIDNQTCGEVGLYAVNNEKVVIPEATFPSSWSWLVTVKIGLEAEDECSSTAETTTATTTSENESGSSQQQEEQYQMSYSMLGIASIAIMGVAGKYASRRVRRGDDDDDQVSYEDCRNSDRSHAHVAQSLAQYLEMTDTDTTTVV